MGSLKVLWPTGRSSSAWSLRLFILPVHLLSYPKPAVRQLLLMTFWRQSVRLPRTTALRPYRTLAGYLIPLATSVCFFEYGAAVPDTYQMVEFLRSGRLHLGNILPKN
jgi:hypothetical protein